MSEESTNEVRVVHTVCNQHCAGSCEIKAHVQGGRLIRLEAGGENERLRHRACAKGRAYRQRVYHPDRLLYPLKRTGARGSGEFTKISWDEATDIVASELKRVKERYGNASILHFCSWCDPFTVHHIQAIHRLLCMFGGYTAPWGAISNEGENFASGTTYGTRVAFKEPEDLKQARLVIFWGWNPVTTNQGNEYNLSMLDATEKGAKFVLVDARYSDSGVTFADQWIPIRPCTDTAVLAAMAYVIVTENLQDQAFIDKYVFGFDKFCDYLLGAADGVKKTPEWAEAISDVPAGSIATLAREYALTKPAMIAEGCAPGRTANGEQFHRAVYALSAITGNTRIPTGADSSQATIRRKAYSTPSLPNPVELGRPARKNSLPYRGSVNSSARVNVNMFADAMLHGKDGGYPGDYKFVWLANNNYLNQLADINKAKEGFQKPDFVLVTEQFMTPTARFADVVLPVCTYLERNDFFAAGTASGVAECYGVVAKAIEPLGESKSQLEICEAIALKLGITDYNDKTDEEWVRSKIASLSKVMDIPSYDKLLKQGLFWPKEDEPSAGWQSVPDEPGRKVFPTPSGKIEIYSQVIAAMGDSLIPPVPTYVETWESRNDPLAEKYPLQLVTPHHKWRAHSQFDNVPWLRSLESQSVAISARDAGERGIGDGETVRVFNDRGEMRIPCRVTERIMPGVVAIHQGAWYSPDSDGIDRRGCPNVLTRNVTSPCGAYPSNTALVQVEKLDNS